MTSFQSFALASLASLAAISTTNAFGLMVPNLVSHPGLSARVLGPATKIYMEPTSRGRGRRGRNNYGGGSFPFGSSPFFPSIEEIMSLYPDMLGVSIPNAAACSPVGGRRGRGGSYYGYGGPCAPSGKQNEQQGSSTGVRYSSDRLGRGGYPRYEIIEEEDAFKLNMDVPGVKEQDIDIAIEGSDFEGGRRFLMVRGVRKVEEIRGITTERRFERSFVLDKNLDESRITATMENGVLTVTAPKLIPAPKNKTIKVAINNTTKKNVDETTSSTAVTSATKNEEGQVNGDEDEDGVTIDLDKEEKTDDIKAESTTSTASDNAESSPPENKKKKEEEEKEEDSV